MTINVLEAVGRLLTVATGEPYGDGEIVTGVCVGYAEPGYGNDESVVVFGNWNPPYRPGQDRKWNGKSIPERLARSLERIGAEIEWHDEWAECEECHRALRTEPNSYSWTPSGSFVEDACGWVCSDCQLAYGEDALEEFINEPHRALTWCEPAHIEQYGYVKWEPGDEHTYESGWHPGQTDDPEEILRSILDREPDAQVLFFIEENSQFYIKFAAYVRTPAKCDHCGAVLVNEDCPNYGDGEFHADDNDSQEG